MHRLEDTQPQITNTAHMPSNNCTSNNPADSQEKMLSVSGKKKCSHCGEELGKCNINIKKCKTQVK